MAIIFRLLRYPRARALAAWMSELVPSSKPLLMRLACQEMIPSQCSSTDLTKCFKRLESRTLCAVAPVAEIRLGSLLWLVVERLEVFTPTQCTRCGQTHRRTSQPGPRLPLLCRQVCLVLQPDIPGLLEQWVVALLNPADVVDRLRQQLHDVEAIERHLRIREVVTDAGDEGVGHVRAGPCDQLGVATVGYQISRKCLDGAGITAFDRKQHPAQQQIHEDRDVVL